MAMLVRKIWRIQQDAPATGPLADRILASRNVSDPDFLAAYFNPSLDQLHDPGLFQDMEAACKILSGAISRKQTIAIHGDYDVDGITSTALLSRFLRRLGVETEIFIPDRMTDGYGLSPCGVSRIIESGCQIVITVDCGISSCDEVRQLKDQGIQVIVTDHHECQSELPPADAVINPKRKDSRYPFRGLAGVGVTLKLVQGLCRHLNLGDIWQDDLDLAALGTVADVVPLVDENRVIVSYGLRQINQRRHCGISALLDVVNMSDKQTTAKTMGYVLAPRINAAGRLGDAAKALRLLDPVDETTAKQAAKDLSELNSRRQAMEASILAEAVSEIDSAFDFDSSDLIVVANENWHQGVIGIVAARLAEQYCRPVIALTGDDGMFRGSCRTWGEFDILAALSAAEAHIDKYGGHRKAAGLAVRMDQLDAFKQAVNDYARQNMDPDQLQPVMMADLTVNLQDLTIGNALAIEELEPFGEENPQPMLVCRNMSLLDVKLTGNGRHMKMQLAGPGGERLDAIAFGMGDADDLFAGGDQVDLLFALDINRWRNRERLQLLVRDIKHSQQLDEFLDQPWIAERLHDESSSLDSVMDRYNVPLDALRPSHTEFKAVYQYIKARYNDETLLTDLSLLARRIARSYRIDINGFRLARILQVFSETNLVVLQRLGEDRVRLSLLPCNQKVRLEESETYQKLQSGGDPA